MERKGRLVYVMGASGSGKDSLLAGLVGTYPEAGLILVRRYITRERTAGGENHIPVTRKHFKELKWKGTFIMDWESHGLMYGIPASICGAVENGHCVLVNGSRRYFTRALQLFPDIVPLVVEVPGELLAARLVRRGREKGRELDERLQGAQTLQKFPQNTLHVDNSGELESTVQEAARKLGLET